MKNLNSILQEVYRSRKYDRNSGRAYVDYQQRRDFKQKELEFELGHETGNPPKRRPAPKPLSPEEEEKRQKEYERQQKKRREDFMKNVGGEEAMKKIIANAKAQAARNKAQKERKK